MQRCGTSARERRKGLVDEALSDATEHDVLSVVSTCAAATRMNRAEDRGMTGCRRFGDLEAR
jgi:hypothetical protein